MELRGIPVCAGCVYQRSFRLAGMPTFDLNAKSSLPLEKREQAVQTAREQMEAELQTAAQAAEEKGEEEQGALLEVQATMLSDDAFLDGISESLTEGYEDFAAVLRSGKALEDMLISLNDEYMSARADDVHDLSYRLACKLTATPYPDLNRLPYSAIVVVQELLPSMLLSADLSKVEGLLIGNGTKTSHVSILASGLQIPTIVGCGDLSAIADGETIFMDAEKGIIRCSMDEAQQAESREKIAAFRKNQEMLRTFGDKPFCSKDGVESKLMVNVTEPLELEHMGGCRISGVGLFRSEFLFLDRATLPTEEEQYQAYRKAAEALQGGELTIRTLDIGGDKEAKCLHLEKEDNPFLGYRAVRICLDQPELILTQLRAILRAACHGKVKIMFPMIALPEELRQMREMVTRAAQSLQEEGIPHRSDVQIGIMVEIPSAVVLLDQLLPMADFVSIGSNDLVQYTFAADRLNTKISYLNNFMHPAALRLIKHTITLAGQYGKECSLCGEMAGDPMGMAVLAILGLRKFSVSPSKLLRCKWNMSLLALDSLQQHGEALLALETAQQTKAYLQSILPEEYGLQ